MLQVREKASIQRNTLAKYKIKPAEYDEAKNKLIALYKKSFVVFISEIEL